VTDVRLALVLVLAAIVLVVSFLRYKSGASERRMMRMMLHYGLDPEIARKGDTETIIKEVRRRCLRCQSEGHCERWLEGKEAGGSDFCPNAKVFEELARSAKL